jgi:Domain of unknown function (DUF4333)
MMATGTPAGGRRERSRRGYWLPAVIAMTVLLGIAAAVGAGDLDHSPPKTLAGSDVASEIAIGMQVQNGSTTPPAVHCPDHEPVRAGLTFRCTLGPGPKRGTVKVVEIDGRGHLRWQVTSATQ